MIVSDLIKQLSALDPELEVVIDCGATEYLSGIASVETGLGYGWAEESGNYHTYPDKVVVISIAEEASHTRCMDDVT